MKISIERNGENVEIDLQKTIDIKSIEVKTVKKHKIEYIKFPLSFDTETSHMLRNGEEIGWIYQWAFTIYNQVVIGRTPSEFCKQLRILYDFLELSEDKRLVCYAHNLSYDIVYLMKFLTPFRNLSISSSVPIVIRTYLFILGWLKYLMKILFSLRYSNISFIS